MRSRASSSFFLSNDTATTEIYTLSLHDALPIFSGEDGRQLGSEGLRLSACAERSDDATLGKVDQGKASASPVDRPRSEEHTSELQSRLHLVCRLLLEKKKKLNK